MGDPVNYIGIVDDRGISLLILHFTGSAKSFGNGRQQCFQTILDQRTYRGIQRTDRPFQHHLVRYHIGGRSSCNLSNGDNTGIQRRYIPGYNGLQGRQDVARNANRIYGFMGMCPMTTFPMDSHFQRVTGGHGRTFPYANGTAGNFRPGMESDNELWMIFFKNPCVNHGLGTVEFFLRRLENQQYSASNIIFSLFQQFCRIQKSGHMQVMPATVGDTCLF